MGWQDAVKNTWIRSDSFPCEKCSSASREYKPVSDDFALSISPDLLRKFAELAVGRINNHKAILSTLFLFSI